MSKRRVFLEKLIAEGSNDPFAHYGLAQEYRSLKRFDESIATFTRIRDKYPTYLASYLMMAQLLEERGRPADASEWCLAGIEYAKLARDAHTIGELESLLERVKSA